MPVEAKVTIWPSTEREAEPGRTLATGSRTSQKRT